MVQKPCHTFCLCHGMDVINHSMIVSFIWPLLIARRYFVSARLHMHGRSQKKFAGLPSFWDGKRVSEKQCDLPMIASFIWPLVIARRHFASAFAGIPSFWGSKSITMNTLGGFGGLGRSIWPHRYTYRYRYTDTFLWFQNHATQFVYAMAWTS